MAAWANGSVRRLAERLRVLRGRGDSFPDQPTDADRATPRIDRLLGSGIFDVEFYTAGAGREFESDRHAARHCLNVGMPRGRSPHPLLDIYSVPRTVRTAWRRGQIGRVLDHLESEAGWAASTGPLFFPPALQSDDVRPDKPGSALAQFVAATDGNWLLPVPPGYWGPAPTYAEARTALVEHARATARALHDDVLTRTPGHDAAIAALLREIEDVVPVPSTSPKVSIVCGPPSSPRRFIETVDRLRCQSLTGWELLVPSGDWDPELNRVVEVASARDPRLKVIESCPGPDTHDTTCASLWNAGGDYVAFLDPDAEWDPEFLRTMTAAMDHHRLIAAQAWLSRDEGDVPLLQSFGESHDRLPYSRNVSLGAAMVRRSLLDGTTVTHACQTLQGPETGLDFLLEVSHETDWPLLPLVAGRLVQSPNAAGAVNGPPVGCARRAAPSAVLQAVSSPVDPCPGAHVGRDPVVRGLPAHHRRGERNPSHDAHRRRRGRDRRQRFEARGGRPPGGGFHQRAAGPLHPARPQPQLRPWQQRRCPDLER